MDEERAVLEANAGPQPPHPRVPTASTIRPFAVSEGPLDRLCICVADTLRRSLPRQEIECPLPACPLRPLLQKNSIQGLPGIEWVIGEIIGREKLVDIVFLRFEARSNLAQ